MSAGPEALPTPQSIAKYVKKNMQKARRSSSMMMMHHKGGQEIIREDDYKGHHVVVRTTYQIKVDGKEVTGHIMLTNAGQVQYHGLPNHSFDSTIELARALIDNFPEDFEKRGKKSGSHGGKTRMNMRGHGKDSGMAGMHMAGMGVRKTRKAGLKKNSLAKSKRPAARRKSK